MCTNLVLYLKNDIFAKLNRMKMVVVSSREFRANQRKYFDLALTNDVVITSRSHGSYRLVPVRESDTLIDQTTLEAKIRRGIEEYEQGKVHRMEEGESVDGFLSRMINEDWSVLGKKAPQEVKNQTSHHWCDVGPFLIT